MPSKINTKVLMSGADYFADTFAINPYMDSSVAVNLALAESEHADIKKHLEQAGIEVTIVGTPEGCQDGVYIANWGLCRNNKMVLSSLPNKRQAEEPYAKKIFEDLGLEIITPPYHFSGQGDALPCGNLLFCGSHYRTDPRMHEFLAQNLGYEVIGLKTIPRLDANGQEVTNSVTGWPDSFFYDIDLAIGILSPGLIAWCPEAFTPESREKIKFVNIDKIEVSFAEATEGFACNLVSNGETVVMSARAPKFKADIETHGLKTLTPNVSELGKGGGYIRCTTLTIDNK